MALKIIVSVMLLAALKLLYSSYSKAEAVAEPTINIAWWNGLSDEWKSIFIINQNFKQQHVDIFKIQKEYANRLQHTGEAEVSETSMPLHEYNEKNTFGLSYTDFYARAIRTGHVQKNDGINLATLPALDTIYMVNGPADLTPLKYFTALKVLIINYVGYNDSLPVSKQQLSLEPLRNVVSLKILQCAHCPLQSLEPLKNLVALEELNCSVTKVSSLSPLKKLRNLKNLSVGSSLANAGAVSQLTTLEELYINGCRQLPDVSALQNLRKLSVADNELSIVDKNYRLANIDFIKGLPALEFIDLSRTLYSGSLQALFNLQHLKAITLPPVSSMEAAAFKAAQPNCIVTNAFSYY